MALLVGCKSPAPPILAAEWTGITGQEKPDQIWDSSPPVKIFQAQLIHMRSKMIKKNLFTIILSGIIVGLLSMALSVGYVSASPLPQEDEPTPEMSDEECSECHIDIHDRWSHSPHANAYEDPYFQEQWQELGNPNDCLACHTTNYQQSTGMYDAEGITCRACHTAMQDHPESVAETEIKSEFCGTCHTTTVNEWRKTGHSLSDVSCIECHNPHSQDPLFEEPDDLCINCHKDDMGDYLNDLHVSEGIGCVDCHALVIPPEEPPEDGIVPTGHAFDITPKTCVACHTDTLHAGFSLPGYENGATVAQEGDDDVEEVEQPPLAQPEEETLNPAQRIQALEAALASSRVSNLFQGAVIGLVLGGSTAWIVARNVRQLPEDEEEEYDAEETQEQ